MTSLCLRDIFKIFKNFEPSSLKIWEVARTFDPIDFAKLIYLLENVVVKKDRVAIEISDVYLYGHESAAILKQSERSTVSLDTPLPDDIYGDADLLPITYEPTVQLERAVWKDAHVVWYSDPTQPNIIDVISREAAIAESDAMSVFDGPAVLSRSAPRPPSPTNTQSYENVAIHRQQQKRQHEWLAEVLAKQHQLTAEENAGHSIDTTLLQQTAAQLYTPFNYNRSAGTNQHHDEHTDVWQLGLNITIDQLMNDIRYQRPPNNIVQRIIAHNIGTYDYHRLIRYIRFLLFTDNLQSDRSLPHVKTPSVVESYIQFYRMMQFRETPDNADPRAFRFMMVAKHRRVQTRELAAIYGTEADIPRDLHVQPLLQGFHVVVYSSAEETKCYNCYGDLIVGLGYKNRCKINCTFEAVILPTDKKHNLRSWQYWKMRTNYIMYVVDVFRVNQKVLTQEPFRTRIKYADAIVANSTCFMKLPVHLDSWSSIEKYYLQCEDLYSPIVGVVLRDGDSVYDASTMYKAPVEFRFNLVYSFDLLNSQIVKLPVDMQPVDYVNRLHLNFEMADYKTVCLAYGHSENYIYLCHYNRHLHQFEHIGRLQRIAYEFSKLEYQSQKLFVVNCRVLPRGMMLLRVYYNQRKQVIGYDAKWSDNRYKLPYHNSLYNEIIRKNRDVDFHHKSAELMSD